MNQSSASPGRGGRRPGAGRKSLCQSRSITVKLPTALLELVDSVAKNRTQFIREALTEKLERMKMRG